MSGRNALLYLMTDATGVLTLHSCRARSLGMWIFFRQKWKGSICGPMLPNECIFRLSATYCRRATLLNTANLCDQELSNFPSATAKALHQWAREGLHLKNKSTECTENSFEILGKWIRFKILNASKMLNYYDEIDLFFVKSIVKKGICNNHLAFGYIVMVQLCSYWTNQELGPTNHWGPPNT